MAAGIMAPGGGKRPPPGDAEDDPAMPTRMIQDEAAPAKASATTANETNSNAEMPRPMKLFARARSLSNDEHLQQ